MHTQHTNLESPNRAAVTPSARQVAADAPLTGIERLMAEARMAPDRGPSGAMSDPGAIEYASWIRLLHCSTP